MEDQEIVVEPTNNKKAPLKNKPPRSSELNVMIVRKKGKVRSFKTSSRFLFLTSLFFALYIFTSVLIINDYFDKRWTNNALSEQLELLQHEIKNTKRELYRSRQHLALLRDHIHPVKPVNNKDEKPPAHERVKTKADHLSSESKSAEESEKKLREPPVTIKGLAFHKEGEILTVSFRIVKVHQNERSLKGYVHVIADGKKSDHPKFWAFPNVHLQNGMPVDYKQGQRFSIKRFKPIKGEFFLNPETESPSSIEVLIYDNSGKLILQKGFQL